MKREKRNVVVAVALCAFAAFMGLSVMGAGKEPEIMPTCQSPQQLSPMQLAGGAYVAAASPVVWNGKDYAVAYTDYTNGYLYFRRFFADGTPVAAPLPLFSADASQAPALVWNGTGYGVAWEYYSTTYGYRVIDFARLDLSGHAIGNVTQVSWYGTTPSGDAYSPALVWSGSGYAVAWQDMRSGTRIYATLLDNNGGVLYHDTVLQSGTNGQYAPTIIWALGSGKYVVAWYDRRSGTHYEIAGASLTTSNAVSNLGIMATGSADSEDPSLAASPNGFGLAWDDYRDGNWEVYFALFSNQGFKVTSDQRLTSNSVYDGFPACVWTGAEYGVFWYQQMTEYNLWFQRVSAAGSATGSNMQVTYVPRAQYPKAAFAQYGYMVTGDDYNWSNYVIPWGCNYAYNPPCPEGPVAYSVTGTGATVAWLPSVDNYSDIAYYLVYRNGALVGKTSDTYYADTGLSSGTTYLYSIRAENAAQYQSTGCASVASIYVTANASLVLKLNKSGNDADLNWTGGIGSSHNVWRGVSPQVMTQLGTGSSTYKDQNALVNPTVYYYSVDEPGH